MTIVGNVHIAASVHGDSIGRGKARRYHYTLGVDAIGQALLENFIALRVADVHIAAGISRHAIGIAEIAGGNRALRRKNI